MTRPPFNLGESGNYDVFQNVDLGHSVNVRVNGAGNKTRCQNCRRYLQLQLPRRETKILHRSVQFNLQNTATVKMKQSITLSHGQFDLNKSYLPSFFISPFLQFLLAANKASTAEIHKMPLPYLGAQSS